ncbi:orotidine 5-phosphate decarboxylase [Sulfitobacter undariae]|nr:orotidine 5-phosphate decarboxylase [Sulfitobacter undariae]
MTQPMIQISDVMYNAATQCFEAMVTVETTTRTAKYPCEIEAPITMSFEQAASGLKTQALRRHKSRNGMYSQMRRRVAQARAGRTAFDPRQWLAQLGFPQTDKAA